MSYNKYTDSECDDSQRFESTNTRQGLCIVSEPDDVTTNIGTNVKLTTIVQSPDPSYQWYDSNGHPIPNKTQSELLIGPVTESDFGFYKLEIIDRAVREKKSTRWIELKKYVQTNQYYTSASGKPRVISSPKGGHYRKGETVKLFGSFENATSYQWYKDGQLIQGCTGNALVITGSDASSSGLYALMAANNYGIEKTEEVRIVIQ